MERPRSSKSAGTNKASTRRLRSRETVELTREASEENVRVYSRDVLEDLLEDASISPTSSFRSRDKALADVSDWGAQATGRSSPAMPPIPGSRSTTRRDSNGSMGIWERGTTPVALSTARRQGKLMTQRELEKMKKKQEEYEKINADYERNQLSIVESHRKRREEKFNEMYGSVLSGMADNGVLSDCDQHIWKADEIKAKKRRELHEEWNTQVFDTIQGRVQDAVTNRSCADIESRLRTQYEDYLKITNEKVGVFRDTIIEADYNPLTANQTAVKYSLRGVNDPLKRDLLKAQGEKMALGLVDMLKDNKLGKDTFDVKWWDKTYATPYGYDVNDDGTIREMKEDPLAAKNKTSKVMFDDYGHPLGSEVPDQEWKSAGPKCKTAHAPGPEQRRNRQNLFETIQQGSNCYEDGRTLGDQWLEYKGKHVPPGPEQRRGRPDLFETFQMQSDPAVDKRSLGDIWLERKGKFNPPGPEQRRNRQDLFETVQEGSNPYKDGRTLGNLWLEHKGKGIGVEAHSEIKNTPKFLQTLSHTVKEVYDPARKRKVIPPPPGRIQGLLYHNAKEERDWPVDDRRTRSNVVIGES